MKYKRIYDFRAFKGVDADIETSIAEYGIAWKRTDIYKYKFVFLGNNGNYHIHEMSKNEFSALVNEEWFDKNTVLNQFSDTIEEFIDDFPYSVYSSVCIHGTLNIFGEQYNEGFKFYNLLYNY